MRTVRLIHLYAGLALSLFLLVLAVTGGVLVYKEAYWRLVYPELRVDQPALGPADHAAAFAVIQDQFGDQLRSVKFPEPGVPAYHLYLRGGEAFLSPDDYRVIDQWRTSERFMSLLFDLHAHFMSGETGETLVGVVGLLGVLMAMTGLVLWWPARRRFKIRNLWWHGGDRRALLRWHRDLGVVISPLLLLLLLSGSGLVFSGTARAILNGIFGDDVPKTEVPAATSAPFYSGPPETSLFEKVNAVFPEARLVFLYPLREGSNLVRFRLKQPCELHPNGRSYLYFDGNTGNVVEKLDACTMLPGERANHALYPLHAGKTGSAIYKLATFAGAMALAILSLTGLITYARKLRKKTTDKNRLPNALSDLK